MSLPAAVGILGRRVLAVVRLRPGGRLGRGARPTPDIDTVRDELVRGAVAAERLRFSSDMHDLVGLSLSALPCKAELADRLITTDPELAREQLAEIAELARRAIADVRSAARGYARLRLDDELCLARTLLTSAAIDVRLIRAAFAIPEEQERVLATVAREGVTNVLRHSKAEHCRISVRQRRDRVQLEIVNDGLTRDRTPPPPCTGTGIRNMSDRLRQAGGELAAGVRPGGTYRLQASLPLR